MHSCTHSPHQVSPKHKKNPSSPTPTTLTTITGPPPPFLHHVTENLPKIQPSPAQHTPHLNNLDWPEDPSRPLVQTRQHGKKSLDLKRCKSEAWHFLSWPRTTSHKPPFTSSSTLCFPVKMLVSFNIYKYQQAYKHTNIHTYIHTDKSSNKPEKKEKKPININSLKQQNSFPISCHQENQKKKQKTTRIST